MRSPGEVFLAPGEFHFSEQPVRIRTLLGSCVSLVAWHPQRRLGGMSHFLLPSRDPRGKHLDGRYGDEAFELMLAEMHRRDSLPLEYRLGLYGGANMFGGNPGDHIGKRNAALAMELLQYHGLKCQSTDLGGRTPRTLIFDVGSGELTLRHSASPPSTGPQSQEVMR